MSSSLPISIGLPVFNGARYIRQALNSLLDQTFPDFELIISDNASTDETPDICADYARRDGRIRWFRQRGNIGASRNWNAVLGEARGRYFRWASANDRAAPSSLALCAGGLDRHSEAVLCYGRTELIDAEGNSLGRYEEDLDVRESQPWERYARVRTNLGLNNLQQALVRREVLLKTRAERHYSGGDLVLSAELALHGCFLLLSEILLYRRTSPDSCTALRSPIERQRTYDPQATRPMRLLLFRLHLDCIATIATAPIPFGEKVRAWACSLRYLRWDRTELASELGSLWRIPLP